MRKLILAALLITPVVGFAAYQDARPEVQIARPSDTGGSPAKHAENPDVICGPEVCVQLVPFRTGMGRREALPEGGS